MNRVLHLLLFTGLAAIFCASCSKDKDLWDIPDSYEPNDSLPFMVEAVPPEACDSLFVYRIKENVNLKERLNLTDASLVFVPGDSIIMEAYTKSGYTFINWVRNGKGVSTEPIYGFKLDSLDIDTLKHVKYHYEARFGLDYALQVIPPIDSIIPIELIAEMGPYLHFGDNPPRIDSFSFNPLHLIHFIHNSDHPEIPYDPQTMYYLADDQPLLNNFQFKFYGQHRGVFDSCSFLRNYGPMNMPDPTNPPPVISYLHEYADTNDSIFIMGSGDDFTIYYHQSMKRRVEPYDALCANNLVGGIDLVRIESVVISGTVSDQGVKNFHWGYRVEQYNKPFVPAWVRRLPAIHDMFHLDDPSNNPNP